MVDVAKVPGMMRAQTRPWGNAARLQDIWFAGASAVAPAYGPPDTATLKMDTWLLTFPRAKDIYDHKIVAGDYWKTPAAEASLRNKIEARGILTGSSPVRIGDLGRPVDIQDLERYQGFPVSSSMTSDPLDDLFGALGDFNLRFVADGRAEPQGGTDWLVTVERVGVYIQDSFDFNGHQPLGFWNETKNEVSKTPGFGFDLVDNGDYRDWRDSHGKGGDFIVFSDIKIITQATPWSFHATGAAATRVVPVLPPLPVPPPSQPAPSAPPAATDVVVVAGDTLSGLAQKNYGDWQLWPLIWDQNRAAIGPRPSMLRIGTSLRLPPRASFTSVQINDARRRSPKWKNSEFP
jgi:LysM repeat protein